MWSTGLSFQILYMDLQHQPEHFVASRRGDRSWRQWVENDCLKWDKTLHCYIFKSTMFLHRQALNSPTPPTATEVDDVMVSLAKAMNASHSINPLSHDPRNYQITLTWSPLQGIQSFKEMGTMQTFKKTGTNGHQLETHSSLDTCSASNSGPICSLDGQVRIGSLTGQRLTWSPV